MTKGKITLESSRKELEEGFAWAKEQALEYAHDGNDIVGLWYEAALPGRMAFCMRDVSHQTYGAAALGLSTHTKNMLYEFAKNINESRDYCTYWEITKDGEPCPDDYVSDEDFWLNHPGSFEVIRACYQQYLWNQDEEYLQKEEFKNYYSLTCNEYVERWDKDGDGIIEHYPEQGRRGIASYNESDISVRQAGDMVASQYVGYKYYEALLNAMGDTKKAEKIRIKKEQMKDIYLKQWYNEAKGTYYSAKRADGSFIDTFAMESSFLPIDMEILDGEETRENACQELLEHEPVNVEGRTYYPQMLYRCGKDEEGYKYLVSLAEKNLDRREYPEVSYSFVGGVTQWLMGIQVVEAGILTTCSRLPETDWVKLNNVPILKTEINVWHQGKESTTLSNLGNEEIVWKATFYGEHENLYCNGDKVNALVERDITRRVVTSISLRVASGQTMTTSIARETHV